MSARQQPLDTGVYIERPPYYHPPRSRPVAFEQPTTNNDPYIGTSCFLSGQTLNNQTLDLERSRQIAQYQSMGIYREQDQQRQQQQQQQQQQYKLPASKLRNLPSHNTSPKPFTRAVQHRNDFGAIHRQQQEDSNNNNSGYYATNINSVGGGTEHDADRRYLRPMQQLQGPRVLLNDQPYPTSTVHKSMLRSLSPVSYRNNNEGNTVDSSGRPISPAMTTTKTAAAPATQAIVGQQPQSSANTTAGQQYHVQRVHHLGHSPDNRRTSGEIYVVGGGGDGATTEHACWLSDPNSYQLDGDGRNKATEDSYKLLPKSSGGGGDGLGPKSLFQVTNVAGSTPIQSGSYVVQEGDGSSKQLHSSNTVLPDTKREEYMWNRQLERESIAHQTYRTLPIVIPKPKARHDLAAGNYMRLSYDPTWDLALQSRPTSAIMRENHERKIQQAIGGSVSGSGSINSGGSQSRTGSRATSAASAATIGGGYHEALVPAFNYRQYIESTRRAYH